MKRIFIYLMLIALAPLTGACEDSLGVDNNVKSSDKDLKNKELNEYIQLKKGSYWNYHLFLLDENGGKISEYSKRRLMVQGEDIYAGEECFFITNYETEIGNDWYIEHYFLIEDGRFYISSEVLMVSSAFDPEGKNGREPKPQKDWLLLIDLNEKETPYDAQEFTFNDRIVFPDVYFTGKCKTQVNRVNDSTIVFNNEEHECLVVERETEVSGKLYLDDIDSTIVIHPYKYHNKICFGKGIGWMFNIYTYPAHDWGIIEYPFISWKDEVYEYSIK